MISSRHSREQALLCDLLKLLRKEKNLTQEQLAERLAVPQSFISKYESGERILNTLELRAVCLAIGIPLPEFAARLEEHLKDET